MKFLFFISVIVGQCDEIYTRPEIRELNQTQRNILTSAVSKFYRTGGISEFAKIHTEYEKYIHKGPMFMPWHRYFINEFQKKIFKIDKNAIIPYWDWTLDYQDPASSPIFKSNYYGGNGNPGGAFNKIQLSYPKDHLLIRVFNKGNKIQQFANQVDIDSIRDNQYDEFNYMTEYIHGKPHVGVGGDMNAMVSPNDPIFFLHHYFIDKQWWDWQQAHQGEVQYRGDRYNINVSEYDPLVYYTSETVKSTFDTTAYPFCYTYKRNLQLNRHRGKIIKLPKDKKKFGNTKDLSTSDLEKLKDKDGKVGFLKSSVPVRNFLTMNHWTKKEIDEADRRMIQLNNRVNYSIAAAKELKNNYRSLLSDLTFE